MDERDLLAERFEANRTHLRAVGYRMLGSLSEADDAVQDAWLRLSAADTSAVENLEGWLTTVVARVCLDMLRSRKSRREQPFGVHVPDPIVDHEDGSDPEHEALIADAVGLALLVVLDTLAPAERLAFVLHDLFALSFDEIAPIVQRSPTAARQLASRARRRVQGRPTVPDADINRQRAVVDAFLSARPCSSVGTSSGCGPARGRLLSSVSGSACPDCAALSASGAPNRSLIHGPATSASSLKRSPPVTTCSAISSRSSRFAARSTDWLRSLVIARTFSSKLSSSRPLISTSSHRPGPRCSEHSCGGR
jgi:RNA polymerase sigma factor (sigma-70 family)